MELIRKRAFARAGFVGNPSDGYNGKTISLVVRDLYATVVLYEWDEIDIVPSQEDQGCFRSIADLARDVRLHGYYGGVRLVKATIKKFFEYVGQHEIPLHSRTFAVRYESNIPRQVGLGGSSAIIVATLRCLMEFYDVEIPLEIQPSLALAVETDELGIGAGLQDRVIQIYEGLVYMDFALDQMREVDGFACGQYERLDPKLLPGVYVAYKSDASGPTEVVHNDLRARYQQGDKKVLEAIERFAELAAVARRAILDGDAALLARLIDENFDLRRDIMRLPRKQAEMVEVARGCGASAKFAGSGGAIVGTYQNEPMFGELREKLEGIHCRVLKPTVS